MRSFYCICFLISSISLFGNDTLKIGLSFDKAISLFEFKVIHGEYDIFCGNKYLKSIYSNESIRIRSFSNQVIIQKEGNKFFFPKDSVKFLARGVEAHFKIISSGLNYNYNGHLMIRSDNDVLKFINELSLDQYLPGVIKAEVGNLNHPEFLKSMAVISRTYAVKNSRKHEMDHFHLCNQTHCQVYTGRVNEYDIKRAINKTKGQILVDTGMQLIDAVYHSNSGGYTSPSKWVWNKEISYLSGIKDTFSNNGNNYFWQAKINKKEWNSFLINKGIKSSEIYSNELIRKEFLDKENKIKMVDVRGHFGLRSAYFKIEEKEDKIMIKGKGYGHGVGLSQEGAYFMAINGQSYDDILFHYYSEVTLTNFSDVQF